MSDLDRRWPRWFCVNETPLAYAIWDGCRFGQEFVKIDGQCVPAYVPLPLPSEPAQVTG